MKHPAIVLSLLLAFSGASSAATFNVQHGYVFDGKYIKPSSGLKATYTATTTNASLYVDVARSVPTIIKTSLGTATVNVLDTLKANKPALVGVTKGFIRGGAVSIAGTLLADYLIQKGWEWMTDTQNYLITTPTDQNNVRTISQFPSNVQSALYPLTTWGYDSRPDGNNWYRVFDHIKIGEPDKSSKERWACAYYKYVGGNYGSGSIGQLGSCVSFVLDALPVSKSPANESDFNNAASDFVNSNPSAAIALNPAVDLDVDGSRSRIPPFALPSQPPTITSTTDGSGNVTTVTDVPHGVIEMPPAATVGTVPLTPTITQVIDTTTTVTKPDGTTTTTQTGTQSKPDVPPKTEEPDLTAPGLAAIPRFYTSKGKTVQSVWSVYKSRVAAAPVFSATGNFFKVNFGGSCPVWSATVYKNLTITIDQFCAPFASTLYAAAQAVLLVLASFFAFRVAVDN